MKPTTPNDLEALERRKAEIAQAAAQHGIWEYAPRWFVRLSTVLKCLYFGIVIALGVFVYIRYRSLDGVGLAAQLLLTVMVFLLLPFRVIARIFSSKRYEQELPEPLKQEYQKTQRAYTKRWATLALYALVGAVAVLVMLVAGVIITNHSFL